MINCLLSTRKIGEGERCLLICLESQHKITDGGSVLSYPTRLFSPVSLPEPVLIESGKVCFSDQLGAEARLSDVLSEAGLDSGKIKEGYLCEELFAAQYGVEFSDYDVGVEYQRSILFALVSQAWMEEVVASSGKRPVRNNVSRVLV